MMQTSGVMLSSPKQLMLCARGSWKPLVMWCTSHLRCWEPSGGCRPAFLPRPHTWSSRGPERTWKRQKSSSLSSMSVMMNYFCSWTGKNACLGRHVHCNCMSSSDLVPILHSWPGLQCKGYPQQPEGRCQGLHGKILVCLSFLIYHSCLTACLYIFFVETVN